MFVNTANQEEHWISVSDMMAGLMMIFLFIAIIYIQNISKYFDQISDVRDDICADLRDEFQLEEQQWGMSICEKGLLISFEGDSNFEINSAKLSPRFKSILDDFFPRLMRVVHKYKDSVSELRIEGHTDSSIRRSDTVLSGYIYNTKLSQERSRNVMDYSLAIDRISGNIDYVMWAYTHLTAHGLSSSHLIKNSQGLEIGSASRRVEFRLRTKQEEHLMNLVREIKSNEV